MFYVASYRDDQHEGIIHHSETLKVAVAFAKTCTSKKMMLYSDKWKEHHLVGIRRANGHIDWLKERG